MPSFLYIGDPGRYYGEPISRVFNDGDTFEADANPDRSRFDEITAGGEGVPQTTQAEPNVDPVTPVQEA